MTQQPVSLPIHTILDEFFSSLNTHNQVIVQAPPGAGKSTELPLQLLLNPQWQGKIIMLEPRRLAAKSIATYVAGRLGEPVGERVGYRIRGERRVSNSTRLEVVTEGVLTRMIQQDPELSGVDFILFDEFHERSIHADLGLALALEVQQVFNEELKLVVMSATLDNLVLKDMMPQAVMHLSEGRGYPIEQRYAPLKPNQSLVNHICQQIRHALHNEPGSILVFLPGIGLINRCLESLKESGAVEPEVDLLPLHGGLSFSAQQTAIKPSPTGHRKVVFATNIAETSLTIEGIRIVIDSGLENRTNIDLTYGITRLEQKSISQSSATQRAGRAGRLEPGLCVRLYAESQFTQSPAHTQPEILRSDLAPLLLETTQWGITELSELQFVDTPGAVAVERGRALLRDLNLLAADLTLTPQGSKALELGTEPRTAAILLNVPPQWRDTALAAVAVLEEPLRGNDDLAYQVSLFQHKRHPKLGMLMSRVQSLAGRLGWTVNLNQIATEQVGICISLGFPDRIGRLRSSQNSQFKLACGHGAFIDESSSLADENWLVAPLLQRGQQNQSRILGAAAVNIAQLESLYPPQVSERVEWNEDKQAMQAAQEWRMGEIVLRSRTIPVSELPAEQIAQGILGYIKRKGLGVLPWSKASEALRSRVICAAAWLPEEDWPDWSDAGLLANLDVWLEPYLTGIHSVKALQGLKLTEILNAALGWPLNQQIDEWLPTQYRVPSGARKTLHYQPGLPPKISVKLQEMFGEPQSPTVAKGRIPVTLELLSPAQRPLQITSDLAGFWAGAYKDVQKEMKGRYPKHPWPDDPQSHQATSKTKRHLNN